jgi:flagellar motor switch protein FliM
MDMMRRKIGAARPVVRGPTAPPERRLGEAAARALQETIGLAARLSGGAAAERELAEVIAGIGAGDLVLLLQAPPAEGPRTAAPPAEGLLVLSAAAVAAWVSARTTGRLPRAAPDPVPPTRTDASICRDIADRMLSDFAAAEAQDRAAAGLSPARTAQRAGAMAGDPRPLLLTMPEGRYRVLEVALDFGPEGSLRGGLTLVQTAAQGVPAAAPPGAVRDAAGAADAAGAGGEDAGADGAAWGPAFSRAVLAAPVTLDAVLARVRLPLDEILAFAPGREVALPVFGVDGVRLEDGEGAAVGTGRLGQLRGQRAIRVVEGRMAENGRGGTEPAGDGLPGLPDPSVPAGAGD